MRSAFPFLSKARSSGCVGHPKGALPSGVFGLMSSSDEGGFTLGGVCRGYGALCLKPPGLSIVPIRDISTANPRVV